MRDKQLKQDCIRLGIELPDEAYDSKNEASMARARKTRMAIGESRQGIESFLDSAEEAARVVEHEELNGGDLDNPEGAYQRAVETLNGCIYLIEKGLLGEPGRQSPPDTAKKGNIIYADFAGSRKNNGSDKP